MRKPRNNYIPLVFLFLLISIIGLATITSYRVELDISRPPTDVACVDEENPDYNYDELYRHVYLSNSNYGFTHVGNGSFSYYKYNIGNTWLTGNDFAIEGPLSLDLTYWVEGFVGEVFHFNITIWEVENDWNGLDVDYNHRPERIGKIGEMELTGIGERVENPVFVYLDLDLEESEEYVSLEISSDIENTSIGIGFSDPDYYYDAWEEDYYEYDYYDQNVGIYYDEPHLFSESARYPEMPWWYFTTIIGISAILIGSIIYLIYSGTRHSDF